MSGPGSVQPAETAGEVLAVASMATDGRGVARAGDGKVVFVEGALPGELVRGAITDERSSWRAATVTEVLEPSPDRVVPPCPRLAEGCGGCQWQHIDPPAQRQLKESMIAESLQRIGRVETPGTVTTVTLDPWAFRTSFRTGVHDGRAALRHARSHDLVPIEGCLIAHPSLADLLAGDRYDGAEEVTVRAGARTGERMAATTPAVAARLPAGVRSDRHHEIVGGRTWRVSAASFFQTRPDGADELVRLVAEAAGEPVRNGRPGRPGRAVDLYSGVGLFAGALAERGWSVVAVEGSASSSADAAHNLRDVDARVEHRDVHRWTARPADVVVADPSRAGLGRGGVRAVTGTGARRVVLVSCDVASLGRDAGLLDRAGYRLASVTAVDMFPQSFHIEAVSVWDGAG